MAVRWGTAGHLPGVGGLVSGGQARPGRAAQHSAHSCPPTTAGEGSVVKRHAHSSPAAETLLFDSPPTQTHPMNGSTPCSAAWASASVVGDQ